MKSVINYMRPSNLDVNRLTLLAHREYQSAAIWTENQLA